MRKNNEVILLPLKAEKKYYSLGLFMSFQYFLRSEIRRTFSKKKKKKLASLVFFYVFLTVK
jgi:hypothetical protein